MPSNPDPNFDKNLSHLVEILKSILSTMPAHGNLAQLSRRFKEHGINLNVFFTFLPIPPEELEELEDLLEKQLADEEKFMQHKELSADLTPFDQDFLRRHGLEY